MNTINKESLRILRQELNNAVAEVAKAHGIKLEFGNAKYSTEGAWGTMTLNIATVNASGVVESKERAAFRVNAELLGFKPEDLGREFMLSGRLFKISGANPKSWAKPVLADDASGKTYKFEADLVKRLLK